MFGVEEEHLKPDNSLQTWAECIVLFVVHCLESLHARCVRCVKARVRLKNSGYTACLGKSAIAYACEEKLVV
jgi:hypothetical protein